MALSDNPNEKNRKRVKPKPKGEVGNFRYSDKQKIEAVNSWLAIGNLAMTARLLNIPEITLRSWKASDWWAKLVEELKMQEKVEMSNRMKKIIEASQAVVAQRLEVGDPYIDQFSGQVMYKPVNMRDAHRVAVDTINQRNVLDKVATEAPTEQSDDNKLAKLAERFAEMATKSIEKQFDKKRTIDVVDVVEVDSAVYDQRKMRLQEGVCEVPLEAGANCQPDSQDDSSQAS